MAINKSKLTKHVWFQRERYKVEQVISPNKYDDYLLLSIKNKNEVHDNGKTTPVYMCIADIGNDDVFLDTKKVRDYFNKVREVKKP